MHYEERNKVIDESRQGEAIQTQLLSNSHKEESNHPGSRKKLYLESYGCQMNFSDSEIVASILTGKGFTTTREVEDADVILINTCAIRDNAEQKVRRRLTDFKKIKQKNPGVVIGMLGCMAERLKSQLLEEEKLVDLVAGPDAYRDLPGLIETAEGGQKAVNVILSKEETYADISPVRLGSNGVSAFISIMRGCDNMCSFCVVPFTRGRERSRDPETIVKEARELFEKGFREITLLGQNVDSYLWCGGGLKKEILTEDQKKNSIDFAQLLAKTANIHPDLRIRFSTSHPKDMTDEVLKVMARYDNICNYIHLPVQSGSSRVLELMNRGYTREWYMDRINSIRKYIPDCGISTDIIAGFCSETEEDHRQTLSMMEWASYDFAYMFIYSERPGTQAQRKMKDDVPPELKAKRLQEIVSLQQKLSLQQNKKAVNKIHRVLAEGLSKRSSQHLSGRNSQNTVVVFPKKHFKPGDYVNVMVKECTAATLIGEAV